MMQILVLYFSGTGNTEYVARYIAKHLDSVNDKITIKPIETFKKERISDYDILFFGFPVYACDLPLFIKKALENMTVTTTRIVFLFCTKAFFSGTAMQNALNIFRKRGYYPMAYADINMPGSDGLAFLKKDSKTVRKIKKRDFSKIKEIDQLIKTSKNVIEDLRKSSVNLDQRHLNERANLLKYLSSQFLGFIFHIAERKMKKKFWADEHCIGCLKCEKICPAENIKVENKSVIFGENCYLCMRCLHQCPMEAIQIGKKTVGKYRWKGPLDDYKPLKLIR